MVIKAVRYHLMITKFIFEIEIRHICSEAPPYPILTIFKVCITLLNLLHVTLVLSCIMIPVIWFALRDCGLANIVCFKSAQ